jgi:hypothetical protein
MLAFWHRPVPVGLAFTDVARLARALAIVKPETVIAWHRKGFRLFWTWQIRRGQAGGSDVSRDVGL